MTIPLIERHSEKFKMKIETIAPFVESAAEIVEKLTGKPAVRGELSVMQDLVTRCPVNIVSGVSGTAHGMVLFGLTRDTAMNLAEIILNKSLRVLDASVSEAIVGLGQKILENSSKNLTSTGIEFSVTPADLIRGVGVCVPTGGHPVLVVPLHFEDIGTIYVKLSVKQVQVQQVA
jgi:chemotaxis protein CheX